MCVEGLSNQRHENGCGGKNGGERDQRHALRGGAEHFLASLLVERGLVRGTRA